MAWLHREKAPLTKGEARVDTPDGLWVKCEKCSEIIFKKDFEANLNVCPKCSFHYYIPARERIKKFLDPETVTELDQDLISNDPLNFHDSQPYKNRIEKSAKNQGNNDAFISVEGKLMDIPVQFGVFDFKFMGGSMGWVVGEKITRLYERAKEKKQPAIVVSASGGARMQEGIVSLMQMAKTCALLAKLKQSGVPYISILTNPTTGGVAASFATLGDVNIGEPGALIGFAGPRVIQQTIGEKLPEGFQTAEYLLAHGMLDMICHRDTLRITIAQILSILFKR